MPKEWIPGAKKVVDDHWQSYRTRYELQKYPGSAQQQVNLGDIDSDDTFDSLDASEYMRVPNASEPAQKVDALATHLSTDTVKGFQLAEWRLMEQKHPDLVQFALDHAAIPISISDCERSFSSAKFALNPLRSKMKSDLFEALETLRAWYLQDHERKQRVERERAEEEEAQIIAEALEN